ncbi:Multidrug efflux system MdtABC-TolC, inner-membrane proton/drug antiporter MdtC (RND type) [Pseudomonas chlororaphis subsp. aureofaciens]|uniref:Multidrug efflux system MdtABC-TolC, inner-membrane proton/drug antiporter MdtC (RND type) n=1 Tax=Pseudomonas chlororaphis subsp. aureofaciens TaxID=587851 RepID=A0AAD0ZGI7_9PSED|nr:efflux RND transporter permease subunit [Pseudomonas chlororaphis]AZE23328.1 Multidrug efflux system MdtABC-TolC, inner-membrane proton/drug antiporter MdtC (RND type) [Pseudomonas chlororaphis subsp. aureofaciens]AZE29625.1 Multidrug efflux system MdtABC-TolC, inner-membrane proton/drug antiporter MdtC (RND type) [Pseudomonas chlororaphis subsp. aureofaciens]AZE35928.1 Multidrug efflux system MdtABC-TolC, inner-membrane proton/drug antiporter MdtC (RND type) [Pseudomonas chlororaphis subsp. 
MNLSGPFIRRPVATMLLSLAIMLLGGVSFGLLPVSPLPQMDFPVIVVQASLPGASPEVMASTVATPLERSFGAIAGVNTMSSRSSQGSTRVILQFDLDRDINGAAREVQAAINASRNLLPSGMRSMPTYKKVNPSQAPIMVLSLTSDVLEKGQLYDLASTILSQSLSQVSGVGEVQIGGSSLPAVRIELEPQLLNQYGVALDDVRKTIAEANVRRPKGSVENSEQMWQVQANDQLEKAKDYEPLIIHYKDGAALRLKDVAKVSDGVEDRYNSGFFNDDAAVLLVINRQAGANIIETVNEIKSQLPALQAVLPASVKLNLAMDRSPVIKATLHEAEMTLLIAVALVILVVYLFLGNLRASLIPTLAVPVSLVGTFAVMYLYGFSLNNLSLMALILATGLVVDDAIVVLENISRHIDEGIAPMKAAYLGAKEVGFTLLSMNVSLVAVFLSILFMGGIIESLFREFSITLAAAIIVSLVVSLTLTPMLCARWLKPHVPGQENGLQRWSQRGNDWMVAKYASSLDWVLRHKRLTLLSLFVTIGVNIALYVVVPKTFMPQQDTGQLIGFVRGDDGLSFTVMQPKMEIFRREVLKDPAVESVAGFIGGNNGTNNAFMLVRLKPIKERNISAQKVIERLRKEMPKVPGAQLMLMADQDLQFGGGREQTTSQYSYIIQSGDLGALREWYPKVVTALRALPELTAIDAREGQGAQQVTLVVDRDQAKRLGIDMNMVTAVLNNAYSQRQISTIYDSLNQYQVVMEVNPKYAQDPITLNQVQVITADGARVPLSTIAHYENSLEDDRVSHEGQFASESISFDMAEGVTVEQGTAAIERALAKVGMPEDVIVKMAGTADAFAATQKSQPFMILGALLAVYLVLGVLYESYIHPLTILSTLPSAGVGALLSIYVLGSQFSLISLLGLFLLIGVVKKNAILMIDLALQLERHQGLGPLESIRSACLLRLRPILMTTLAAILGALPLLLGSAEGAEMRQPLGLTIIGGLVFSQILTLYTTPVVYLYLDRLRHKFNHWRGVRTDAALETPL